VHRIVFDDERKDEAEIVCLLLFYIVTPRGRVLVDTIQSVNRYLLAGWRLGGGCAVHSFIDTINHPVRAAGVFAR